MSVEVYSATTGAAMSLFDPNSQHREYASLWKVMSLLPLRMGLADGHMFRWYAVNIPMSVSGDTSFTNEIDVIAKFQEYPPSDRWFYRTWEVKVCRLNLDGSVSSLKDSESKERDKLKQLNAYRRFGAPHVSMLDACVGETGFFQANSSAPPGVEAAMTARTTSLSEHGFGYQMLVFELGRPGDLVEVWVMRGGERQGDNLLKLAEAHTTTEGPAFQALTQKLDACFEAADGRLHKNFHQIVYCRACKALKLVRMKLEEACPDCKAILWQQS